MRADAERNRAAILVAARKLFAERGLGVPFDLIASAAVRRARTDPSFKEAAAPISTAIQESDAIGAIEQLVRGI